MNSSHVMQTAALRTVVLDGVLGRAIEASGSGRLSSFIVGPDSPAILIFGPLLRDGNIQGDWYGEHAGKWLYAAAKSAARSRDPVLLERLLGVADYLVSVQEPDGYLGTYAPGHRFKQPQPPKPGSWDGAPSVRTWDVWTHAYLILGLLEVHRHFPNAVYLQAARRIGDLCWRTLHEDCIDITELGNHHGMSATVLMDPAVELFLATGESRYLELAELIVQQADRNPQLGLMTRALAGADASEIATGKAYQLAWNLVGLAKLHKATGKPEYRQAVENLWRSIRDQHLTLGGGPWGGVAHRSREVFNAPGQFFPQAYVETCSLLAWLQLNRELLIVTGEARYAQEIERTAYNDLLGAMAPDGEDWCYYSFANGRRVHTTYWRCCKSSGAMALEELPAIAYTLAAEDVISINLLGPSEATLALAHGTVRLQQRTGYPFDGSINIRIGPGRDVEFAVQVRIPDWAQGATLAINGVAAKLAIEAGTFARLRRVWQEGDEISLDLPMAPTPHFRSQSNVQESRAPDGAPVRQLVMRFDYLAVTRGPLVYATGLIDGFKTEETVHLQSGPAGQWLHWERDDSAEDSDRNGDHHHIRLETAARQPLWLLPYYRAGGRVHGAWRLTWLSLPPAAEPDAQDTA